MPNFIENIYQEFYNAPRPKELRDGQHAFNWIHDKLPDIANQLRGTDADPFYDDSRLVNFWREVNRLYNEQSS